VEEEGACRLWSSDLWFSRRREVIEEDGACQLRSLVGSPDCSARGGGSTETTVAALDSVGGGAHHRRWRLRCQVEVESKSRVMSRRDGEKTDGRRRFEGKRGQQNDRSRLIEGRTVGRQNPRRKTTLRFLISSRDLLADIHVPYNMRKIPNTLSVLKYMTPLTFFVNFNHSSYSKYLIKNVKFQVMLKQP
jgi:hypothetical protein